MAPWSRYLIGVIGNDVANLIKQSTAYYTYNRELLTRPKVAWVKYFQYKLVCGEKTLLWPQSGFWWVITYQLSLLLRDQTGLILMSEYESLKTNCIKNYSLPQLDFGRFHVWVVENSMPFNWNIYRWWWVKYGMTCKVKYRVKCGRRISAILTSSSSLFCDTTLKVHSGMLATQADLSGAWDDFLFTNHIASYCCKKLCKCVLYLLWF